MNFVQRGSSASGKLMQNQNICKDDGDRCGCLVCDIVSSDSSGGICCYNRSLEASSIMCFMLLPDLCPTNFYTGSSCCRSSHRLSGLRILPSSVACCPHLQLVLQETLIQEAFEAIDAPSCTCCRVRLQQVQDGDGQASNTVSVIFLQCGLRYHEVDASLHEQTADSRATGYTVLRFLISPRHRRARASRVFQTCKLHVRQLRSRVVIYNRQRTQWAQLATGPAYQFRPLLPQARIKWGSLFSKPFPWRGSVCSLNY